MRKRKLRKRSRNSSEEERMETEELRSELGEDVRRMMGIPDARDGSGQDGPRRDAEELRPRKRRRRAKRSTVYTVLSYFFVFIFVALVGYVVYFNLCLREEILRSPYNKRQDALAEFVVRGSIRSADGEVLAYSTEGGDGTVYRTYPYGRMYAHVVGYDTHGKSGLETIANYELLTSHTSIAEKLKNEFIGLKNQGDTVWSTIDSRLQYAAYTALGDRRGAVVVMDPRTGAVKAMVSKPDFDPNTIASSWEEIIGEEGSSVLVNRATQGRYPPGSTFKIVTSLAYGRANGGNYGGFHYDCTGELTDSSGHTIHCQNNHAHGAEDFQAALSRSCNCAFATIGLEVGADALSDAATSLLFNKKLPSAGLASNSSSFTLDKNSGRPLVMQTSFGQGNTLTSPFHMALIVSAIANDGVLMTPTLVDHVTSPGGTEVDRTQPKRYKQLLTSEEAGTLKDMMTQIVRDGIYPSLLGTGYECGGKTGSADYVRPDGTIGTHGWFVGFMDPEDPDLVFAVLVEDGGGGSEAAVPVAKTLMDVYYSIQGNF